jgi:hypothetical protein
MINWFKKAIHYEPTCETSDSEGHHCTNKPVYLMMLNEKDVWLCKECIIRDEC